MRWRKKISDALADRTMRAIRSIFSTCNAFAKEVF
jgi:hypothetical protein